MEASTSTTSNAGIGSSTNPDRQLAIIGPMPLEGIVESMDIDSGYIHIIT